MANLLPGNVSDMRRRVAELPFTRTAKRRIERHVLGTNRPETLANLAQFVPNSTGSLADLVALTFTAVNETFPLLGKLLETLGHKLIVPIKAEDFYRHQDVDTAHALKKLFDHYGSDKSIHHNYHFVYGRILRDLPSLKALLEVGLGSNSEKVVSNMGLHGRPGASLRAFRDYLPKARIYGADIDKDILFTEDRIQTFFVDQTDLAAVAALGQNIPGELDVIIDDGLHSPNANIAMLIFAYQKLAKGGWFVIEDIAAASAPIWQVIDAMKPAEYETYLIDAQFGFMYVGKKNS